jgi:hypothetical protein
LAKQEFNVTKLLLGLFSLLLLCSAADPLAGIDVNPVPKWFKEGSRSMSAAKNTGEIKFYGNPDPAKLTLAERYLLFGAMSKDGRITIRPQWEMVRMIATVHEARHGQLPGAMDAAMINAAYSELLDDASVAEYRNPITGEFPRIDAVEFSPGDMYFKRLTPEELAAVLGDPTDMPADAAAGKAYYVRVYGEKDVILSKVVIDADMSKLSPGDLPSNPNRPESVKQLIGE